jgi:predicted Zn-dependent protease with MMP-like domain
MPYHVSKARFAELVEQALAELPPQFARFLEEVPLEIKDRPSRKLLRSLGMDDDELLLGLYQGHALTNRSVEYSAGTPGDSALDVIYIFQEDVELVSENEAQLKHEVRTTVLHEIGHHFGLDEDELDRLGYG